MGKKLLQEIANVGAARLDEFAAAEGLSKLANISRVGLSGERREAFLDF